MEIWKNKINIFSLFVCGFDCASLSYHTQHLSAPCMYTFWKGHTCWGGMEGFYSKCMAGYRRGNKCQAWNWLEQVGFSSQTQAWGYKTAFQVKPKPKAESKSKTRQVQVDLSCPGQLISSFLQGCHRQENLSPYSD